VAGWVNFLGLDRETLARMRLLVNACQTENQLTIWQLTLQLSNPQAMYTVSQKTTPTWHPITLAYMNWFDFGDKFWQKCARFLRHSYTGAHLAVAIGSVRNRTTSTSAILALICHIGVWKKENKFSIFLNYIQSLISRPPFPVTSELRVPATGSWDNNNNNHWWQLTTVQR